jgi:hypothetical protein
MISDDDDNGGDDVHDVHDDFNFNFKYDDYGNDIDSFINMHHYFKSLE